MKSIDYLWGEFRRRSSKNNAYSMSSFARDLSLSVSFLHRVMHGKKALSEEKGHHVAQVLNWQSKETEAYLALLRYEKCKDPDVSLKLEKQLQLLLSQNDGSQQNLDDDAFKIIKYWYHGAILELIDTKDFRHDSLWIASKLGITEVEAVLALERLKRIGLITVSQGGKISRSKALISVPAAPSAAKRYYHQQMLKKAEHALHHQDFAQRSISGMTLAIRQSDMTKANELIRKFRRQFTQEMQIEDDKDAVYQLSVEFFRIDRDL